MKCKLCDIGNLHLQKRPKFGRLLAILGILMTLPGWGGIACGVLLHTDSRTTQGAVALGMLTGELESEGVPSSVAKLATSDSPADWAEASRLASDEHRPRVEAASRTAKVIEEMKKDPDYKVPQEVRRRANQFLLVSGLLLIVSYTLMCSKRLYVCDQCRAAHPVA